MDIKDFLGLAASILALGGYVPYLIGMYKGQVHPHVFSWLVWGLLTGIGFMLQMSAGAGPGAWVTGVTAIICVIITIWSLKVGEKNITRSDWAAFIASLAAIPVWLSADNPVLAMVLITVIDGMAFWPTVRKSWMKPWDEALSEYVVATIKFGIALFALSQVTLVTALYPAALVVMHAAFIVMALWRRRVLSALR
jgi:chromate transport protein ChrA